MSCGDQRTVHCGVWRFSSLSLYGSVFILEAPDPIFFSLNVVNNLIFQSDCSMPCLVFFVFLGVAILRSVYIWSCFLFPSLWLLHLPSQVVFYSMLSSILLYFMISFLSLSPRAESQIQGLVLARQALYRPAEPQPPAPTKPPAPPILILFYLYRFASMLPTSGRYLRKSDEGVGSPEPACGAGN